jgi:glutamate-1-semialdehyde 2,1-aminomutase
MAAMAEFLRRIDEPDIASLYQDLDERWNARARRLNERLAAEDVPVRVSNMSTIWTIRHLAPSRYNWMLQFYLRAEGLALSWIGTGRLIFTLDYTDAEFDAVGARFLAACRAMARDGWWWAPPNATNRTIKGRIVREMIAHRFGRATPAAAPTPVAPLPEDARLSSRR